METSIVDLNFITSLYKSLKHNENVAFSPYLAAKALGRTDKDLPRDPEISLRLDASDNTLVNTICFTQYSNMGPYVEKFTTGSGEILKVEMQHAMKPLFFSNDPDLNASVSSFSHKGSHCLRLFMILPNSNSSLEELEGKLENTTFESIIGKLQRMNTFVNTPMFKVDTSVDLAVSEFLPDSGDDQTRIQHKVSFEIAKEVVPPKPIYGPQHCSGIVQGHFVAGRPVIFFVANMSSDEKIDDILIYGKLGRPLLK